MIGGFSPWFSAELSRRITHERQERAETLLNGNCADYAAYRYEVGFFAGMQEALEIADQIRKEQEAA